MMIIMKNGVDGPFLDITKSMVAIWASWLGRFFVNGGCR